jgi:hypothetical protein
MHKKTPSGGGKAGPPKRGRGRPSKYSDSLVEQAISLLKSKASMSETARFIGVHRNTVANWQRRSEVQDAGVPDRLRRARRTGRLAPTSYPTTTPSPRSLGMLPPLPELRELSRAVTRYYLDLPLERTPAQRQAFDVLLGICGPLATALGGARNEHAKLEAASCTAAIAEGLARWQHHRLRLLSLVNEAARIFHDECDEWRAVRLVIEEAPRIDKRFRALRSTPDKRDLTRSKLRESAAEALRMSRRRRLSQEERDEWAAEAELLTRLARDFVRGASKDIRQLDGYRQARVGRGVVYTQLSRLAPGRGSGVRRHTERAATERVCAHLSASVGAFGDRSTAQAFRCFAQVTRAGRNGKDVHE